VRAHPRAAFGICSAIESDATTHRTSNSESFRESSTFPHTAGRQCENPEARALAGIIRLRAATAGQADTGYNRSLSIFTDRPP